VIDVLALAARLPTGKDIAYEPSPDNSIGERAGFRLNELLKLQHESIAVFVLGVVE
jgi:hypothetical protein